ncbi:hypothetical protein C2G38_2197262 [Gigaspora rosea]|uniref:Uncharacterized protein n=1 Tax=Gigaspora rosea TaxID=44941 RepID=A0A397UTT0_9GLOM|nr:hypothetical protein C2G38_2197262 [Gigaspora rosea]
MPFANVRVSKRSKTLYGWYIHPISYEITLREFFHKIIDKIPSNAPDCNIIELTNEFGRNVHYRLSANELQPRNLHNALDIIMRSAQNRQLYAPLFKYLQPNRKQQLRLDIVEWIQQHESGWPTQTLTDNEGKQFVIALSDALWYIDMRDRTKLQERNYYIPQLFLEFLDQVNLEAYKEARHYLTQTS